MARELATSCDAICKLRRIRGIKGVFSETTYDLRRRVTVEYHCGMGKDDCIVLYLMKQVDFAIRK